MKGQKYFVKKTKNFVVWKNRLQPACYFKDCTKAPRYNKLGEKNPILCNKHAEEGMIDIYDKRCEREGCIKRPNFNFPDKKGGRFCGKHAEEGMINVNAKRCENVEETTPVLIYPIKTSAIANFVRNVKKTV